MNFENKILNDVISKDFNKSLHACEMLINHNNFAAYKELVEKSEFIFDFILEKINKNLKKSINKDNFLNIFTFLKIYTECFENFIIDSLLEFANEDLTDTLLSKLENGTLPEKCWATIYFTHVIDPLSLENIEKNINSKDDRLKTLSIKALKAHGVTKYYDQALEKLNSSDEEIAFNGFRFLTEYGEKKAFKPIFSYLQKSIYKVPLAADAVYFMDLNSIKKEIGEFEAGYIFNLLIEGIPEMIKPDEFIMHEIYEYFKEITRLKPNGNTAVQALRAKNKINLIQDESYIFDLNKNIKQLIFDLKKISDSISDDYWEDAECALKYNFENKENIFETLELIKELKLSEYSDIIIDYLKNTSETSIICKCCEILKDFGKLSEINTENTLKIAKTESAKSLLKSYFSEI